MATGTLTRREREKITAEQTRAWQYYGLPGAPGDTPKGINANGEVRYIIGWFADQITRIQWRVTIDGSEDWSVETPDGQRISPTTTPGEDGEPDVAAASAELLKLVGWDQNAVRQTTTNLFVAGELDYLATTSDDGSRDRWIVVSVIHPDRKKLLNEAEYRTCGLWPHPADPNRPDAPLFGVLDVLEELDWLSRLSRSQSASRIAMRGVLGVADGMAFAGGGDFWQEWNAAVRASMDDPTNVSPLVLRGPAELTEPTSGGMKGLAWAIPNFPYDDKVDARMEKLIQRLAYGLPIPPELLLGMQAQSRATAFQVEESGYRAHIEPAAQLVAQIPQDALSLVLPDVGEVTVTPDPSILLARRHSVQDVKDALAVGAVGYAYYREVLAIPEEAAATPEDIALMQAVKGTSTTSEADPGNEAADEAPAEAAGTAGQAAITAAADATVGTAEDAPLSEDELADLATALSDIDLTARSELSGATALAVDRAREKLGAQARTRPELRAKVDADVPNSDVPRALGLDVLGGAGIAIEESVAASVQPLGEWWSRRVDQAYDETRALLGEDAAPRFSEADRDASVDLLVTLTAGHIVDTIDSPVAQPLPMARVRRVLAVAGGDPTAAVVD